MKLTIVETGRAPEAIRLDFPSYPEMFQSLLSPHSAQLTFETIALEQGEDLPDPATLEAILITGSAAGVYEKHVWMEPLLGFIRGAARARVPQIGICFGHQAMAKALGGEVVKSDKGWGLGRHTYKVAEHMEWMTSAPREAVSIAVSHQDQVVTPPPGAKVVVTSDFTPYAGLSYADGLGLSFQCHPEFSVEFSGALYQSRLDRPLTEEEVRRAVVSLGEEADNAVLGQWMCKFLDGTHH